MQRSFSCGAGSWTDIATWTDIASWTAIESPDCPHSAEMLPSLLAASSSQLQPLPQAGCVGVYGCVCVLSASGFTQTSPLSLSATKAGGFHASLGDASLCFLSAVLQPACSWGAEPHWLVPAEGKSSFLEVFAAGTGSGGEIPPSSSVRHLVTTL